MGTKKHIVLGFIILLLLAVTILTNCGRYDMLSKTFSFSELIESENIDDISLTIYYSPLHILRLFNWDVDNLINNYDLKIIINGRDLEKHIDLSKQIKLIPVYKKSYLDAYVYYVLESKKNGKLFDAAMWCSDNSMLVNGLKVKENEALYDVIMPFLPEEATRELEKCLGGTEQSNFIFRIENVALPNGQMLKYDPTIPIDESVTNARIARISEVSTKLPKDTTPTGKVRYQHPDSNLPWYGDFVSQGKLTNVSSTKVEKIKQKNQPEKSDRWNNRTP